jgi:capsular polysaccharide transport system permease protein
MIESQKPRVVPLPSPEKGHLLTPPVREKAFRPRDLRRRIVKASFVICVLVPTFLAGLYYAFIASDRYVAGAGFAVRGVDHGSMDIIGSFTGLASTGSTTSDSYILLNFLKSRDLVEKLEARLPFRDIYSGNGADFLSRLDPSLSIESVVEYWEKCLHTTFDNTSGVLTLHVEAFTPEDAERVASVVLDEATKLVNELSGRARQDAVAYAEGEVNRAEVRLKASLDALRSFRETEKALDPAGAAKIQMELIGGLEKQLTEVSARIAALKGEVTEDSPSMRSLKRQAQALEQEITRQRAEIGADDNGAQNALTGQLAAYETLDVEREFAQKAYASALGSLEKARVEADRQQRYLAVYSNPARAEYPLYPRRILNVFLIFSGFALLWGIGTLIVWSVRDHLA